MFKVGDRVKISERGKMAYGHSVHNPYDEIGTITSVTSTRIEVNWGNCRSNIYYHHDINHYLKIEGWKLIKGTRNFYNPAFKKMVNPNGKVIDKEEVGELEDINIRLFDKLHFFKDKGIEGFIGNKVFFKDFTSVLW